MIRSFFNKHLSQKLKDRLSSNSLRSLSADRAAIDFYSNDYLGFATQGLPQGFPHETPGLSQGSSGSRLLSGNSKEVMVLEEYIADFHQTESALIFNSGYDANLGVLACLAPPEAAIVYDELCHASILDGIKLSKAGSKIRFKHNDLEDLEEKLREQARPALLVVESVYSMDGDQAPLQELTLLAKRFGASLIVDEAHATGVWGNHGQGLVQHLNLEEEVDVRIHTFGKALGGHGAVVVGSRMLKEYLTNFARSFIYTTALPPVSIDYIRRVYEFMRGSMFSNKTLHETISYFNQRAQLIDLPGWREQNSAIQALVLGDPAKAKEASSTAVLAGMQVNAIVYPSVARGSERLRICLHTFNTRSEMDGLLEVLESCLCGTS
jgi:8-amino-7-oxononanoate synthase